MTIDVTQHKIPPYVLEEIIEFWSNKRLKMEYRKPKAIRPRSLPSPDAPTDFSSAMTCLMSLVHLFDAAYLLNDSILKRSAFAALRQRLVDLEFRLLEFVEALDEVYSRRANCERIRILRQIFLAAAVENAKLFQTDGCAARGMFHDLQLWIPDFQTHYNKGQEFRLAVRDWQ